MPKKYLTEKQLLKHIKQFKRFTRRKFHREEDHEDCVSWVSVYFINDHSRTYSYEYAYVAYMRGKYGRVEKDEDFGNKYALNVCCAYMDEIHYLTTEDSFQLDDVQKYAYQKAYKKFHRKEVIDYIKQDYTFKEIGYIFGVTESRISQYLKEFIEKVRLEEKRATKSKMKAFFKSNQVGDIEEKPSDDSINKNEFINMLNVDLELKECLKSLVFRKEKE